MLGKSRSRLEGFLPICRETKNKRSKHVHAVPLEGSEAFGQSFSGTIEILEDRLQAFCCDCLDSDQCAFNMGLLHRVQEVRVLSGFHGDLRVEHHVGWKLGEAFHQLKTLGAKSL